MLSASELTQRVLQILAPPPKMTVSQWADAERRLSPEASAVPGRWRTEVVEYMREPMDCIGDPRIRRVSIMAGAQIAKTEVLLNIIGYCIDYEPSPIMVVNPTLDMAKTFSKDRVAPMLRDTPALRGKVADVRSRDSGNTIQQKMFPGGHLTMVGANSPSSLASRPIRVVLADEIDRFPPSAGAEGDPLQLAIKRTVTFWNRIIAVVSTPTNKGVSRIEMAYEEGDQRQRWCPCPECGEFQTIKWSGVKWTDNDPDTAYYACEHNGCVWTDAQRIRAVRQGEWRAGKPFNGNASFHIPGMLSPFSPMSDGVREFMEAKGHPDRLRVWVNTYLGETWEDEGDRLDHHELYARREVYETFIPEGVTLLTAGVDVQDDRIEVEVVGWGDDYRSWSIQYSVLYGDPSGNALWQELDAVLEQIFEHPLFGDMIIRASCVDSGGHYTQQVYDYSRGRHRVLAIKGIGGEGKPMIGTPSKNNIGKIPLFPVGVHTVKEVMFARLRVRNPDDAGYCHFSEDRTEEYFQQLTAEKLMTKFHKGFKKMEYVKAAGARNEALDNRVYATAALEVLRVDLRAQRRSMENKIRVDKTTEEKPVKTKPNRGKPSYVDEWRNY